MQINNYKTEDQESKNFSPLNNAETLDEYWHKNVKTNMNHIEMN